MRTRKFLKNLGNEFVYGGHLLSLSLLGIVVASAIILKINFTLDSLIIVYLVVQVIYSYNRYKEIEQDIITNPERSEYLKKQKNFFPFLISFYILLLGLLLISYSGAGAAYLVLVMVFLGVSYTMIFKRFTYKFLGFKNIFVAFTSSLLAPYLAFYYSNSLGWSVLLLSIFIFLKTFINTSFSDVKDIGADKKEGLKTLAIYLGEKRLLIFLKILSISSIIPLLIGVYIDELPYYSLFLFLTVFYNFYCFKEFEKRKKKQEKIFSILVDAEFYLWPVTVFVGKIIFNIGQELL